MKNGCPWSDLTASSIEFCEKASCTWIRELGNTWSNLPFLGVAFWIFTKTRESDRHLRPIAYAAFFTGIGSFFFHASETYLGEVLDYAGLFFWSCLMFAIALRRWFFLSRKRLQWLFWLTFFLSLGAFFLLPGINRDLFASEVTLCSLAEVRLFFRDGKTINYRPLAWLYAAFIPGIILWILDLKHILCFPESHWINGHAAWHVLDAVTFIFGYLYYRQFQVLRFSPGTPLGTRSFLMD